MWKCDRRIWRGKNGKLYEDGDPRGWELVAAAGDELESKPTVEKSLVDPSRDERSGAQSSRKSLHPAEDKSLKPSENKGGKSGKKIEIPEPFPPLDGDEDEDKSDITPAPGN